MQLSISMHLIISYFWCACLSFISRGVVSVLTDHVLAGYMSSRGSFMSACKSCVPYAPLTSLTSHLRHHFTETGYRDL